MAVKSTVESIHAQGLCHKVIVMINGEVSVGYHVNGYSGVLNGSAASMKFITTFKEHF